MVKPQGFIHADVDVEGRKSIRTSATPSMIMMCKHWRFVILVMYLPFQELLLLVVFAHV